MYILCLKSFLSFTTVHYYFNFCSILSLHKICICKQYFINFTHKGPNIDYIVQITLYDKLKKLFLVWLHCLCSNWYHLLYITSSHYVSPDKNLLSNLFGMSDKTHLCNLHTMFTFKNKKIIQKFWKNYGYSHSLVWHGTILSGTEIQTKQFNVIEIKQLRHSCPYFRRIVHFPVSKHNSWTKFNVFRLSWMKILTSKQTFF